MLKQDRHCTYPLCIILIKKDVPYIVTFMQSLHNKNKESTQHCLTHALLNRNKSSLGNSVNRDQMASDKAIRSGFALLSMQPQKPIATGKISDSVI